MATWSKCATASASQENPDDLLFTECDAATAQALAGFESRVDVRANPPPPSTLRHKQPHANEPRFEARTELYRITGVELTQVPGLQVSTALVLFGELGPDFVQRFPTAKCFVSWLDLCPDNRITGGRIISVKTRDVKSRSAEALRLAAQALWQSKTYLGDASAAGRRGWTRPRPSPRWRTNWRASSGTC